MVSRTNSQRSSVQIPAAAHKSVYWSGFRRSWILTQICYAANSLISSKTWLSNSASFPARIVVHVLSNSGGVPREP
jgi:hypothetical protein